MILSITFSKQYQSCNIILLLLLNSFYFFKILIFVCRKYLRTLTIKLLTF